MVVVLELQKDLRRYLHVPYGAGRDHRQTVHEEERRWEEGGEISRGMPVFVYAAVDWMQCPSLFSWVVALDALFIALVEARGGCLFPHVT